MINLLTWLHGRMRAKYEEHTRLNAFRSLWKYSFETPLMHERFDAFWHVDVSSDSILGLRQIPEQHSLSHSERALLGIWQLHVSGNTDLLPNFSMRSIVGNQRQRLFVIMAALRYLDFS